MKFNCIHNYSCFTPILDNSSRTCKVITWSYSLKN
nr:MAG TPA: hypothetical protein [Caudoviricetes sp.]